MSAFYLDTLTHTRKVKEQCGLFVCSGVRNFSSSALVFFDVLVLSPKCTAVLVNEIFLERNNCHFQDIHTLQSD